MANILRNRILAAQICNQHGHATTTLQIAEKGKQNFLMLIKEEYILPYISRYK